MTLYCDGCEVAWSADESPRCWICNAPGYPYIVRLTSGLVNNVKALPPHPSDTQDKVVFP